MEYRYAQNSPADERLDMLERISAYDVLIIIDELRDLFRKAGFNPNQPRAPAGGPDGGQWTGGNSGGFTNAPSITDNRIRGIGDNLTDVKVRYTDDITGESKPVPESWSRPETFEDHVENHAHQFDAKDGEDYAEQAQDFLQKGIEEKLPTVMNKQGYVKIYDAKTNTFGTYSPEGKVETFFKPKDEIDYFKNEIKNTVRNGGKVVYPLPDEFMLPEDTIIPFE